MQQQRSRMSIQLVPPTTRQTARAAVARFKERQERRQLAREMVAVIARDHGHVLGPWRRDDDAIELTQCRTCGDGARLDLQRAAVRVTAGLHAPCSGGGDLPCHALEVGGAAVRN